MNIRLLKLCAALCMTVAVVFTLFLSIGYAQTLFDAFVVWRYPTSWVHRLASANDEQLYFFCFNCDAEYDLYVTDGTWGGTHGVKDLADRGYWIVDHTYVEETDTLFFVLHTPDDVNQLWKSDGTSDGTVPVIAEWPEEYDQAIPEELTNVDGTLFFRLTTNYDWYGELWLSDGTPAGTVPVRKWDSEVGPLGLAEFKGNLYFGLAGLGSSQTGLWRSDGTENGTVLVLNDPISFIHRIASANDERLYFFCWLCEGGYELYVTDGTSGGTRGLKDLADGNDDWIGDHTYVEETDTLFFTLHTDLDDDNQDQLWKSDGTSDGTVPVITEWPEEYDQAIPEELTNVNGNLFFRLTTNGSDYGELWLSDGTPAGTVPVRKWDTEVGPEGLAEFKDTLFFGLSGFDQQAGLWAASYPVDLSIEKSGPSSVTKGDNFTYEVTIRNNSELPATGVQLIDNIPGELGLITATPSRGTCTEDIPVICDLRTIDAVDAVIVSITVEANVPGTITNRVEVFGFHPMGGNADSVVTVISPASDTDDTDGDGLPDVWELNGYDHDGDGFPDVDLPAMGAKPGRIDIFVEIDYMVDIICNRIVCGDALNHEPKPGAIDILIAKAFANAPVDNPDRSMGISLHADSGPESMMNPITRETWGDLSDGSPVDYHLLLGSVDQDGRYDWSDFESIKESNFLPVPAREPIFHYAVFAHQIRDGRNDSTSGISRNASDNFEGGASDFIVSLGHSGWGDTIEEQAGTFMHELGHNLGLKHGGDAHTGCKPNYLSVMNRLFQMDGLTIDGNSANYDYSRFAPTDLPDLDETNLDEGVGLNGGSNLDGYETKFRIGHSDLEYGECPGQDEHIVTVRNANGPINWNNNNYDDEVGVSADINGDNLCIAPGPDGVLQTAPTPDDNRPLIGDVRFIGNGANGRCDSRAIGDDVQLSILTSFNDWEHLVFDGGAIGQPGAGQYLPMITELDELAESISAPYKVSVTKSKDISFPTDYTVVYTFTVTNLGINSDTYTVTASSSLGWADLSNVPDSLPLSAGSQAEIPITVNVPVVVQQDALDELTISAFSQSSPPIYDIAIARTWLAKKTYLPSIMKDSVHAPDLVIDNLIATGDAVTVTIRNAGNDSVNDAFWVDVYFNPREVPSVNNRWDMIADHGVVWAVEAGREHPLNLPITPGESRVLTFDTRYVGDRGSSPPPYPAGDDVDVYGLVDSIDFSTDHGAVLESNETNNLFGPVTSTAGTGETSAAVSDQGSPLSEDLPSREQD